MFGIVPKLQQQALETALVVQSPKLRALLEHPAGPFTIHFWAPTAKWLLSISNILDYNRPPESMSIPQQLALAATGLIWSRYATQITPVNYNLLSVNFVMSLTAFYHLGRVAKFEYINWKSEKIIAQRQRLLAAAPAL